MSVFIGYPSFMAYQMMKGKKGNNDGFPSIPGMIARYSALGLTNEEMSKNPVWKDLTGNGLDLQMKNFAWSRMSGVGGYVTKKDVYEYDLDYYSHVFIEAEAKVHDFYIVFELIGYDENFKDGFNLDVRSTSQGLKYRKTYTKNGIYIFQYKDEEGLDNLFAIGYNGNGGARSNFTVKVLPLYPGALVFDGVDDYGICDNFPILTKEKGYTVVALRRWITYNPNAISAIATNASDQSFNGAFTFENYNKGAEQTISYGATQISLQYSKSPFSWQTTSKYNGVNIANGNKDATNSLVLGRSYPQRNDFANFAIWELVFLDHDATEEELTKIKDYFVKTYPWLFPDQAWTVVGKTNEDKDRATIANITGNGNDLVLSNFGFAEGSGYGLYAYNFNSFELRDNVVKPTDVKKDSFRIIGIGNNGNVLVLSNTSNSAHWKIRITGMKEGDSCIVGNANKSGDCIKIIKDGTYTFQKQYAATSINGIWYNSSQEVDVLVEQIPEYEGYLVTDGVDDKIVSSSFGMGKDFTIVGDWKFIDNKKNGTGLVKGSSFYIYNAMIGLDLYINSGSVKNSLDGIKSINAACSDGRIYDPNWDEILANTGNVVGSGGMLEVSSSGGRFGRIAFKNFAIYPRILSKDDCIKAYNYLQTLKAK